VIIGIVNVTIRFVTNNGTLFYLTCKEKLHVDLKIFSAAFYYSTLQTKPLCNRASHFKKGVG